jgi:hypothetical protein
MASAFEKRVVYQNAVADEIAAIIKGIVIPANAGIQSGSGARSSRARTFWPAAPSFLQVGAFGENVEQFSVLPQRVMIAPAVENRSN